MAEEAAGSGAASIAERAGSGSTYRGKSMNEGANSQIVSKQSILGVVRG